MINDPKGLMSIGLYSNEKGFPDKGKAYKGKDASFKVAGNKRVEQACSNAGEQVVKEGKINMEFMEDVSDVGITQKKFQEQADYFWESLDGKASYLKSSPKLEYTDDT